MLSLMTTAIMIVVAVWESISLKSGAAKAFSGEVDAGSR
jgi:formate/nitrite transporter FocA (FNT family)